MRSSSSAQVWQAQREVAAERERVLAPIRALADRLIASHDTGTDYGAAYSDAERHCGESIHEAITQAAASVASPATTPEGSR
jgi:hypothetical protein